MLTMIKREVFKMKNLKGGVVLGGMILLGAAWGRAQGEEQPKQPDAWYVPVPRVDMDAKDSQREELIKRLMTELQSQINNEGPDKKRFASPFHKVLKAIGDWRVEEAVSLLIPLIEFRMDPNSFPIGATFPDDAYYPVA